MTRLVLDARLVQTNPLPLQTTLFPLQKTPHQPGGNPGANLKSISHRCHPILVAFAWELPEETINLPLGCLGKKLLGGCQTASARCAKECNHSPCWVCGPLTLAPKRSQAGEISETNSKRLLRGRQIAVVRGAKKRLHPTWRQISSQSSTDATRFWWHLYGS